MNRRGQMEELGETKQMPRMAMAQLAGARQNRVHNRWRFTIAREGNGLGLGLGRPNERE
jgi:hypothetical protein